MVYAIRLEKINCLETHPEIFLEYKEPQTQCSKLIILN